MNFPVELRKIIYTSVVPVECGCNRGTAFFVAPGMLLTARHVVVDYALNNQPVIIKTDKQVLCDVIFLGEDGDNIDVVLLKCKEYQQNESLKLLAAVFNERRQLTIIGYPKEFGKGTELISIDVQDRLNTKKEDYDTMVVRTDALAFTTYKGFSGSPVLNEKGSVIGITVNQHHSSLGYVSVKSIAERLAKESVPVSHDWQDEDFSPLGRGTSQKQVMGSLDYAALRYNRELHISNAQRDYEIDLFAIRTKKDEIEKELAQIETLALSDALQIKKDLSGYESGDYKNLLEKLSICKVENKEKMLPAAHDFFQKDFPRLQALVNDRSTCNSSVVLLKGNAGMGKTHYVCATAERLCKVMNVYLLFGSHFVEDRDFEEQLYALMKIGVNNLKTLNDEMAEKNSNALIVIDALNEGATVTFWQIAMKKMVNMLTSCQHIKLLITYRDEDGFHLTISPREIYLSGFGRNTSLAVEKYFKHYNISDDNGEIKRSFQKEFNEPLFLSVFCSAIYSEGSYSRDDFSYSNLFRQYIRYRNEVVSKGVDEDPYRNVTEKALLKFAHYSLYYTGCKTIPRQKARHYADQICRNRTWSHSLLCWLLKENLVLSSSMDGIMFGYQKMGDYLMADVFSRSKMSDKAKVDFVIEKSSNRDYFNFLLALLSEWELTPTLLEKKESTSDAMVRLVLGSLKHYGKNNQAIFDWMKANNIYSLEILREYMDNLSIDVFMTVHQTLKSMEMSQRDKEWSVTISDIFSNSYHVKRLEEFIEMDVDKYPLEDVKKALLFLCWMCTSPHPHVRGSVLRKFVSLLEEDTLLALFMLDEFHDCNDPYVVQVCMCAIYGHLLRCRDKDESVAIADRVLRYFYQNHKAPEDILVRQWTMMILALADELNADAHYFEQIRPPFASVDPFSQMNDYKQNTGNDYFGSSCGSRRMYDTLYDLSDFNRYIIGTNNSRDSHVFMRQEGNTVKPLSLDEIILLIAHIAKHDFKWNDDLGQLDGNVYSDNRFRNLSERFGKKYLWLALFKADALLCDNFSVLDNARFLSSPKKEDLEPQPYPWHTREYSRIDPSVIGEVDTLPYTQFQASAMEDVESVSNANWLQKDYKIQKPRLLLKDIDGSEWIVLTCYDGHQTGAEEDTVKELFLFSNAAFVKNDELQVFKDWAVSQNFHGRWMPERRNGSINYLWNEYPWAPTYKRTLRGQEDFNNGTYWTGFHLELSYEAQLQEDWTGLNEDNANLKEVSMPNHYMMEQLNLFTAERGVVKSKSDYSVVARNFAIGVMNGLTIKKEYLERYLDSNNYTLVFYSFGEKYVRGKDNYQRIGNEYDLSGAYYYGKGAIREIQAMHISGSIPLPQNMTEENRKDQISL